MRKILTAAAAIGVFAFAIPVKANQQCWLPGTVQVFTAERQLTVRGTICTDLPPHIKHYLSAQSWKSAINGCTTVRINDRGPFIGARELDLSRGAAASNRINSILALQMLR